MYLASTFVIFYLCNNCISIKVTVQREENTDAHRRRGTCWEENICHIPRVEFHAECPVPPETGDTPTPSHPAPRTCLFPSHLPVYSCNDEPVGQPKPGSSFHFTPSRGIAMKYTGAAKASGPSPQHRPGGQKRTGDGTLDALRASISHTLSKPLAKPHGELTFARR